MGSYWSLENYVWKTILPHDYFGKAFFITSWNELQDLNTWLDPEQAVDQLSRDNEFLREYIEPDWHERWALEEQYHNASPDERRVLDDEREYVVFGPLLPKVVLAFGIEHKYDEEDFVDAAAYRSTDEVLQ